MNSSPFFAPISRTQSDSRVLTRVAASPESRFSPRRRRALCIGFLLVWPAFYAGRAHSAPFQSALLPQTLRLGKSATFPLSAGARWFIEEGAANAVIDSGRDAFTVRGIAAGNLRLRVEKSDGSLERLAFRFVAPGLMAPASTLPLIPAPTSALANVPATTSSARPAFVPVETPATQQFVSRRSQWQMTPLDGVDPLTQVPPIASTSGVASSPASGSPAIGVNPKTAPAGFPNGGARINPPAGSSKRPDFAEFDVAFLFSSFWWNPQFAS